VPIQHAVLALLSEGESYGYELRAEFQDAVGPQWGELNIGHLYQVLERLVRDGLVIKRAVEQDRLPDRVVYRLTAEGRRELRNWLRTPFVRQAGYRDDFFLKLMAASLLGRKELDGTLRIQREAYLAELGALSALRAQHVGEPVVSLLIEAAIRHTDVNLQIVEEAQLRAEALTAFAESRQPRSRPTAPSSREARSRGAG
jgi:DNA-binding PadR family transcriptional regulator